VQYRENFLIKNTKTPYYNQSGSHKQTQDAYSRGELMGGRYILFTRDQEKEDGPSLGRQNNGPLRLGTMSRGKDLTKK